MYLATVLLLKEPNKYDARRISARHMPLQKGSFECCAVVNVHRYAYPVRYTMSFVYENKNNNGENLSSSSLVYGEIYVAENPCRRLMRN